jgi:hypothetical protein
MMAVGYREGWVVICSMHGALSYTSDNGGPALVADGDKKVKIRYSLVAHTRAIAVLRVGVGGWATSLAQEFTYDSATELRWAI